MKTLKSFYRALRKIAPDFYWRETKRGIRAYSWDDLNNKCPYCPVTAVVRARTGKRYGVNDLGDLCDENEELISMDLASDISSGSDVDSQNDREKTSFYHEEYRRINKNLKKCVGLE